MRKRVLLALMLIAALVAATGCSLIVKDEEVDKLTPVAEIAGKSITKGEVADQTDYLLDYYEYMYSMYGMPFDRTSEETLTTVREEALHTLMQSVVIEQKIAEMGLDQFSAEEEAEMTAMVEESYNSSAEFVKTAMLADTELTGDALQAEIDRQMAAMGYGTKEEMLEDERLNRANNKLVDEVIKDVKVTEEELASEYATRMEGDKSYYATSPAGYGTDLSNGMVPYYTPAGYRYVKHILLTFNEADQVIIDDLNTRISAASEEEKPALEEQLKTATENAYLGLQPKLDEISAKLATGESFDSLIAEYNQDPGMTADSVGYAVSADSTNWVKEFTEGSMALANVGDVSDPVRSSYGIHLIQYASDIPEGEIGLDAVRAELEEELLSVKQDNHFAEVVEKWIAEANPKVF